MTLASRIASVDAEPDLRDAAAVRPAVAGPLFEGAADATLTAAAAAAAAAAPGGEIVGIATAGRGSIAVVGTDTDAGIDGGRSDTMLLSRVDTASSGPRITVGDVVEGAICSATWDG